MKKPSIQSSKTVYSGFFDVQTDLLRYDEKLFEYSSLHLSTNAAVIIAQDREGRFILNREYRHPTREWILGCPGGRLEKDEEPLAGGQRELSEETGYWSDEICIIGSCYPLPSLLNQKIYFLWAKNAFLKGEQHLDPFELIKTELKTLEEIQQEIKTGAPVDSMVSAALWYKSLFTC